MKVLHINTLTSGGAARGCINLHLGLLEQNIDSNILFLNESGNIRNGESYWQFHEKVILPELQKRSLFKKFNDKVENLTGNSHYARYLKHAGKMKQIEQSRDKKFEVFTSPLTICEITKHPLYLQADVVHLHWVNNFLDYKEFFTNNTKPLFWTLHEMFPFTGGCSFSMDCRQFEHSCKKCPQLSDTDFPEYVDFLFNYKKENLARNNLPLKIITPSFWLSENSKKSSLLGRYPHYVVPYSIENQFFHVGLRNTAKSQLGLDEKKTVILFVSDSVTNERKGTQYLFPVIEKLSSEENNDNLLFVTVGSGDLDLGKKHKHLGKITSVDKMANVYAAADVFICPSLEDNFPNTILESLLVGTPVIGFPSGGIPEMIAEGKSGMIVPEISQESLCTTITEWLQQKSVFNNIAIASEALEKYKLDVQAKKLIDLYKTVV